MEIIIWAVVLVVSLFFLIQASGYFTDSAVELGLFLGLPTFIVGLTIVAVGTSLPELISSIIAVTEGASEIVIGNVVGSNIVNILFIFGLAAVIGSKIKIPRNILRIDLPFLMAVTFLLAISIWDGQFDLFEAVLSLAVFVIFIFYTAGESRTEMTIREVPKLGPDGQKSRRFNTKDIVILIISATVIYFSAKFTVDSVLQLSELVNIGTESIALVIIAFGTSVPELAITLVAVRKKRLEIAAGNVLGSNIFNASVVIGIPALLGTISVPQSILVFGLPMMLIATVLFFVMTQDREVTKWEGALLLILYIFFVVQYFNYCLPTTCFFA